jgi:hypothetical protein
MNNKVIVKKDNYGNRIIFYDITEEVKELMGNFVSQAEIELFRNYVYCRYVYDKNDYDMTEEEEVIKAEKCKNNIFNSEVT